MNKEDIMMERSDKGGEISKEIGIRNVTKNVMHVKDSEYPIKINTTTWEYYAVCLQHKAVKDTEVGVGTAT